MLQVKNLSHFFEGGKFLVCTTFISQGFPEEAMIQMSLIQELFPLSLASVKVEMQRLVESLCTITHIKF